ncbi:hypothetical protein CLOSTMETH_03210 [[Clostridium] methylpentosum DSM 5476]|uniref:Uncharacterized protein n=1 Tax=[Clostridium] methylpentosum DSM 5476 TaxID=537013 RepID=C0EHH3_9FIRM|nr:hypothetical protein CLOSTMETH_03210 [[Clostridium] methylpentosum DSM 5476]
MRLFPRFHKCFAPTTKFFKELPAKGCGVAWIRQSGTQGEKLFKKRIPTAICGRAELYCK